MLGKTVKFYILFLLGPCIFLSSCCWTWRVGVDFCNQTSSPVKLVHMGVASGKHPFSHDTDTISHEIDAGSSLKLRFWVLNSMLIVNDTCFFKFETKTKSVCYRGRGGVEEVINTDKKHTEFIITDSLFNSKK